MANLFTIWLILVIYLTQSIEIEIYQIKAEINNIYIIKCTFLPNNLKLKFTEYVNYNLLIFSIQ